MGQKISAG